MAASAGPGAGTQGEVGFALRNISMIGTLRMLSRLVLLAFLAGCCFVLFGAENRVVEAGERNTPRAVSGQADFSGLSFSADAPAFSLDGEWEFYWQQLLSPMDFARGIQGLPQMVKVPGPWNPYAPRTDNLAGFGYGTYRLTITAPKNIRSLALDFASPRTAHKLWVNGTLVSSDGVVSPSAEIGEARYYNKIIPVSAANGTVELVLQVSNYLHYKGGLRRSILLGDYRAMERRYSRENVGRVFTFGAMATVGFFYIMLFSIRRSEKAALFFGLFVLFISLREITLDSIILLQLIPDLPQSVILRIEYLSMFGLVVYTWFVDALLPEYMPKKLLQGLFCLSALQIGFILYSPVWFFSRYLFLTNLFLAAVLLYLLFIIVKATLRKDPSSGFLLCGHVILLASITNDQLYYSDLIQTGNFYSWGLLALTGIQAVLIMKRFIAAFDAVEALNQRLAKMDKFKDDFLAEVSHELLTPVHGINGFLESIRDSAAQRLAADERRTLDTAIGINRRLGNLVADIQTFLRLRHRDIVLRTENIQLRSQVELIIATCRIMIGDKELILVNSVDPAIYVRADRDKLQQVLHNLIENALKYTENGKIEIYAMAGDEVAVHVSDTGVGIPEEYCRTIFEPYIRVAESGKERPEGSGLGLSIAKKLVGLQGGGIWVKSKAGTGSTFSFTLPSGTEPASEPSQEAAEAARTAGEPSQFPAGVEATILIVDDEPLNLDILAHHLSNHSFRIVRAGDGRQALEEMEKERFDLVVLDLMMPDMSGYEVCRHIREKYPLVELPVIILTVRNKPDDIVQALSAGANDYLCKPFAKKELLARISSLILMKKSYHAAIISQRRFLLAQIEPHFFYNVMNTIMGLCLSEPVRAYELLGEFSSLIRRRLHMNNQKQTIQIGEELALIVSYLRIEQARFGEAIRYEICCEASTTLQIPPLLLEPLVENAVKHGLCEKPGGGCVTITIRPMGDEVEFRVADDGVGIDSEKIRSLLTGDMAGDGIGIDNICRRLRIEFGRDLHIEAGENGGVQVWFCIPAKEGAKA